MPRQMSNNRNLQRQRVSILQSFVDLQSTGSKQSTCVERSSRTAVLDLIPQLLTILTPQIRQVSIHVTLAYFSKRQWTD